MSVIRMGELVVRPKLRGDATDNLRLVNGSWASAEAPCCLCGASGCPWDHLAGWPFCFECHEDVMCGHQEGLCFGLDERSCLICSRRGTVPYLTFPLVEPDLVEMDLCAKHLEALLARRLRPKAYRRLRASLNQFGYAVEQFFLLHEAFYDEQGNALQPM